VDKHRISTEVWDNQSVLLDCHIPKQHPACIDDEMEYHYYDKQIDKGIELLEAAGFIDSDNDGWREGPGPEGPGTIEIGSLYIQSNYYISHNKNEILLDEIIQSFISLGFDARSEWSGTYPISGLGCPIVRDYHMWLGEYDWDTFDLDHYARDMSSNYLDIIGYNYPNWSNDSWDTYAHSVLSSLDYDEILYTVRKMENVWVHACPAIILYQNKQYTACRTDNFHGQIFSNYSGIGNFFTNLRIHNKDDSDSIGGVYTWANPRDTYSFNHFSLNTPYATNILQMLFDSLVRSGPDNEDIPWLCESYVVQTHADDNNIPEGHTRIVVDIIKNATWSDGTPIYACDFLFTLTFIRDHTPEGAELTNLKKCYLTDEYQFVCEFDTESYWNWHSIAYKSVIRQKVWEDYTEDYDEYQPSPSTLDDMVTSGPFYASTWVQGDFVELKQNPFYWKNPRKLQYDSTTTTSSDTTATTQHGILGIGPIIVMTGSFICVVFVGVIILRFIKY
jgi:ABC-type transport system substrate-binding protein